VELGVIGSKVPRDRARVCSLIELPVVKPDRERLDRSIC
jgi:hypothetical protein